MFDITTPNLNPQVVWSLVHRDTTALLAALDLRNSVGVGVLRGAALMTPALLRSRIPTTDLRASKGEVVSYAPFAHRPKRIVIYDTLADSGDTFLNVGRFLADHYPSAEIECVAVYATLQSLERVREHYPMTACKKIGKRYDCFVESCFDIPYDFGQVAQTAGLTKAA